MYMFKTICRVCKTYLYNLIRMQLLVPLTSTDLEELRDDVRSRLWFTYRRGFPNIGKLFLKNCCLCAQYIFLSPKLI